MRKKIFGLAISAFLLFLVIAPLNLYAAETTMDAEAEVVTTVGVITLNNLRFQEVTPGMTKVIREGDPGAGEVLVSSVPGAAIEVLASMSATGKATAIITMNGFTVPANELDITDLTLYAASNDAEATGEILHLTLGASGEETVYVGGTLAVPEDAVTDNYSQTIYIIAQH